MSFDHSGLIFHHHPTKHFVFRDAWLMWEAVLCVSLAGCTWDVLLDVVLDSYKDEPCLC